MIGINKEIYNRIRLTIAAYAYEYRDNPIMTDCDFDQLSKLINPSEKTGNRKLDSFFKKHFNPNTGMWIYKHPELSKVSYLYEKYYNGKNN